MPAPKPKDAQAAYAIKRALVEVRLEELKTALQKHEAERPIQWGHVGDMTFAERGLAALVSFLLGQAPSSKP